MKDKQIDVSVDKPFLRQEQTRKILESSSDGPVSEELLNRLLRVAELAVRTELDRVAPGNKLLGLRVGYTAAKPGGTLLQEPVYSVGWGHLPQDEQKIEIVEDDSKLQDDPIIDPKKNPLSFEFIDKLRDQLEAAMRELTPAERLKGRNLTAFVYGTTNPSCFGDACTCVIREGNCRWRRYYVGDDGECTSYCRRKKCDC
jgi:hypothetical protein